jgi:hypothetical protein
VGRAPGSHSRRAIVARRPAPTSPYVVCARFGLDTGERSFPYVATWSGEPALFRTALTRIQTLSSLMIDKLEPPTAQGSSVQE